MKAYIWVHDRTFHSWSMMGEPNLNEAMYSRAAAIVLAATEEEAVAMLLSRNEGWRQEDLGRLKPKVVEINQAAVLYSHVQ